MPSGREAISQRNQPLLAQRIVEHKIARARLVAWQCVGRLAVDAHQIVRPKRPTLDAQRGLGADEVIGQRIAVGAGIGGGGRDVPTGIIAQRRVIHSVIARGQHHRRLDAAPKHPPPVARLHPLHRGRSRATGHPVRAEGRRRARRAVPATANVLRPARLPVPCIGPAPLRRPGPTARAARSSSPATRSSRTPLPTGACRHRRAGRSHGAAKSRARSREYPGSQAHPAARKNHRAEPPRHRTTVACPGVERIEKSDIAQISAARLGVRRKGSQHDLRVGIGRTDVHGSLAEQAQVVGRIDGTRAQCGAMFG